jgi:hypothetical protein
MFQLIIIYKDLRNKLVIEIKHCYSIFVNINDDKTIFHTRKVIALEINP